MTKNVKGVIAISLFGTALGLFCLWYGFAQSGTLASRGPIVIGTPFVAGGIALFTVFNWQVLRTLTGIRLFGFLSKDKEERKSVREFSWILLGYAVTILPGTVWVVGTQSVSIIAIVTVATSAAFLLFSLLVPASNGELAIKKFKKEFPTPKK